MLGLNKESVQMNKNNDRKQFFVEDVITTVSRILTEFNLDYTFDFKKSPWNETYYLNIVDDDYHHFQLELTEPKVNHLQQKNQSELERYICLQLKKQGFPISAQVSGDNSYA